MFQDFANVWTPVEDASLLKKKPLAVRIAGENLVLFRDGQGKAHALMDRCPHRSVALSLGKVSESGCLECPFHGWQFDGQGSCSMIPFNPLPEAKRDRFRVQAFPTEELGGLIWVYTGVGQAPALEAPALLQSTQHYFTLMTENWRTHWTRAMENMLDFPHLPYAHANTIGRVLKKTLRPDSKLDLKIDERETGFMVTNWADGKQTEALIEWRRPNCSVLSLGDGRMELVFHIFCIPLDAQTTKMLLVKTTSSRPWPIKRSFDEYVNRKILFEDRVIVESSTPAEAPDPAEERSVGTDGPTLAFRRYYLKKLKGSSASLEGDDQSSFTA